MTGLVGWWPLHEQSGDANDLSGNGNHGTVNGAIQGVAGRGGLTAYSFDGTDDNVQTSLPVSLTDFSISGWVKQRSHTDNAVFDTRGGGNVPNLLVYIDDRDSDSVNELRLTMTDGSSNQTRMYADKDTTLDEWFHIAVVRDTSVSNGPSGVSMYINGVAETTITEADQGTAATVANSGQVARIGSNNDASLNFFDGVISGVRLYNRVLSSEEVETLYEWGAAGLGSIPEQDKGGVAYYKLDGDGADSWGDNNGTLVNDVVAATGIRNEALSFDGNGDSVQVSSPNSSLDMDTWSASAWFKPDSAQESIIVIKRDDSNPNQNFAVKIFSNGIIRVNHTISNSFISTDSPSDSYTDGEWNHVIGTNDGTDIRIYLNGNLIATGSGDGGISDQGASQELRIGENTNGADDFSGEIDEVRIYNRALGGDEVKALYNYDDGGNLLGELANPPGNNDGGISWYEFRGDATDSWGSNDGTVNGATFVSNAGPRGQGAYSFDGVDDYIDTGVLLDTDSQSVCFWLNPDVDLGGGDSRVFFGARNDATDFMTCSVFSGIAYFGWEVGGSDRRVTFSDSMPANEWRHYTLTWNETSGETVLYRNGVRVDSTSGLSPLSLTSGAYIGARNSSSGPTEHYAPCDMSDVRIYDIELSPAEVHEIYRYGTLGRDMRELTVNAR